MGRHRALGESDADIGEIAVYIAHDNANAAERLIDKFDHALALLSDFPGMGRDARTLRQSGDGSYPVDTYLLFYVAEGGIELGRVVHGMRELSKLFPRP